MQTDHSSVHQTEIHRIQTLELGGWEFVCHSCGYRARYTIDRQGTQKLEILFVGNASTRHTRGLAPESELGSPEAPPRCALPEDDWKPPQDEFQLPPDDAGLDPADFLAGEADLPLELQEQVEAILRRWD